MRDKELKELLARYHAGKPTLQDQAFLESWYLKYNQHPYAMTEAQRISDVGIIWSNIKQETGVFIEKQEISIPAGQLDNMPVKLSPNVSYKKIRIWTTAAAILLITSVGLFFYRTGLNAQHIKPGKNVATLTLANGKIINLSDAKTGVIIDATKLSYNDGTKIKDPAINDHLNSRYAALNTTLTTPKGGQYQITLPDGTKVWLNAASSLTYPSTYATLKQRRVILKGEAYFEVTKDKTHPFIVVTDQQEVEVLGTHFNISSYADEANTKTTLLEGSVKVSNLKSHRFSLLKPNQQSILTDNDINVIPVKAEYAVAWKNGFFMFNSENLETVMNKIARWYNINVVYEDPLVKKEIFFGTISKFEKITKVLNMLERTEVVKFSVTGNTITVSKEHPEN